MQGGAGRTEQTQSVQTTTEVELHLVIKAIWAPVLVVEWDADRLPEGIQLQAAGSARVHDAGVVNNLHLDTHLACTGKQVHVGCGTA